MTPTPPPVSVQLWAPGVDASLLVAGLRQAGLTVREAPPESDVPPELPLLVGYVDPLGCCQQQDVEQAVAATAALVEGLPRLLAPSRPCRLLNLGCLCIPAVVAWCVQPTLSPEHVFPHCFPEPGPLDALLALELLRREPRLAAHYMALEQHPLAARQDQRAIDAHHVERYQWACRWESLVQAREQHNLLQRDICQLAEQLEPLHANRLTCLDLQAEIQRLSSRLLQAEHLKERCGDLELSLQAQQLDLEVLGRRLSLLEGLLTAASGASQSLQVRLAQVLAA
jgi:hypothetical protein